MKFLVVACLLVACAAGSPVLPLSESEGAQLQAILEAIHSPSTNPATAQLLLQQLEQVLGAAPVAVGPAVVLPPTAGAAVPSPVQVVDQLPAPSPVQVVDQLPVAPSPVQVVDQLPVAPSPVQVVDSFPVAPAPVAPAPIAPAPIEEPSAPAAPAASAPLVQIILNINQADFAAPSVPAPSPAIDLPELSPAPVVLPEPVQVVDQLPVAPSPVQVVDQLPVVPSPVQVVDQLPVVPAPVQVVPVMPSPVQVVDQLPAVVPSPVVIPEPVIVAPPAFPSPAVVLPDILN